MSTRSQLPRLLGPLALAILFGAGPVHAQSTTAGQAGDRASSAAAMSKGESGASASSSSAAGKSADGKMTKTDRTLMTEIARANIDEIEGGKLAQEKSKDVKVQDFGKRMVEDHTKALDELKQLAQAKGVTLPTKPDAKHRKMMDKLEKMSGAEFDRQYMAQGGVADHRKTHKLLQRAESRATDPDLKALIAKTLPVVDQHLAIAQEMTGKNGAAAQASGSSAQAGSSAAGAGKSDQAGQGKNGK